MAEALEVYLGGWEARVEQLKAVVGLPERLYVLARGASLAAASCGALIAKEAAKPPVEAMSSPQFRHGPLELADERLTAIVLAGTAPTASATGALYEDLERLGAVAVWADVDGDLPLAVTPEDGRPMAEIVALQLLTVALAELTGVPAGEFRHLEKVTTVERASSRSTSAGRTSARPWSTRTGRSSRAAPRRPNATVRGRCSRSRRRWSTCG